MPEITVEIWCSCGNGLCNQASTDKYGTGIIVEPCEKCVETARDEGHDAGYHEGYETRTTEEAQND